MPLNYDYWTSFKTRKTFSLATLSYTTKNYHQKIYSKEKCHTSYLQLKERLSDEMKKQTTLVKKSYFKVEVFLFSHFFWLFKESRPKTKKYLYKINF